MPDYQKLYLGLFNEVTNAIAALEKWNFGEAKQLLIEAQIRAEELYMEEAESTAAVTERTSVP